MEGVEPSSNNFSTQTSTSVVCYCLFPQFFANKHAWNFGSLYLPIIPKARNNFVSYFSRRLIRTSRPYGKTTLHLRQRMLIDYQRLFLFRFFKVAKATIHYSLSILLNYCRNPLHPHSTYFYIILSFFNLYNYFFIISCIFFGYMLI